jgi:diaminopimelate epimerase
VTGLAVWKGHGTENDFVLIADLDGELDLTESLVRALCDRHAGIGADGVLRVVRSVNEPAARGMAEVAPFFMDYRNADGSIAEMCGNGVRVFMRYLQQAGLAGPRAAIATRGGIRQTWLAAEGVDDVPITVAMGQARLLDLAPAVATDNAAHESSAPLTGIAVEVPNPHVVVDIATMPELAALDLSRPPLVQPALPHGQNVEFTVQRGPRHLAMRVHERGVGETRSCGTGICAAVVAASVRAGIGADGSLWQVDVPGGSCQVRWQPDGELLLTGPAVLVAEIELSAGWVAAASNDLAPAAGAELGTD